MTRVLTSIVVNVTLLLIETCSDAIARVTHG